MRYLGACDQGPRGRYFAPGDYCMAHIFTGIRIFLLAICGSLAAASPNGAAAGELTQDTERAFGRNAGVTIERVRLGRHPDKLRLVLDATGPVNFDYRLSESGKSIVVLIPQITWNAKDYIRMDQRSRIYRISFFPNQSGGGVLSILGRSKLGLSAIEQIGPEGKLPYRVVFDIPVAEEDAWLPVGGIVRNGKLLPAHEEWPPVQQALAGGAPPLIKRPMIAGGAPKATFTAVQQERSQTVENMR
jgi:hypothetical protein